MEHDVIFYTLTTVSLFFFAVEILLNSIAREGYFLGFFFWLDLISTVSLITDIGWIWDEIVGTSNNEGESADAAQNSAQLARSSRGAKIGSRAGRIARVIRLVRLIRVVKLYKNANYILQDKDNQADAMADQFPIEQKQNKPGAEDDVQK